MPGLLFSVFRQVGVARKVAWTWMWISAAGVWLRDPGRQHRE